MNQSRHERKPNGIFNKPLHESRISNNGSSIDIVRNADICIQEIRQYCKLQEEGQSLVRAAMTQLNLSMRASHYILKPARTMADLAGREEIQSVHLAEALHASRSS